MKKLVLGIAMVMVTAGISGAGQGNMRDALQSLREARAALEKAEDNKGGHKQKAIDLVDKAIAQVEEGIDFAADKKH
jgi:predicted ATPase